MPKSKAEREMSHRAKAEVLAGVLHELENWGRLPKKHGRFVHRALYDCSVDLRALTARDLADIRAWFAANKV